MENPDSVQIATAGEALIDLIGRPDGLFDPCLGGAVYNLTRALARQGVGTLYLNPLSSDRFGRALTQMLVDDGVHLAQPEPVSQVTSLAVVGLTAEGHPDYAFYREGVADRQVSAQGMTVACAAHAGLQIVCTGALALDVRDADIYLPWLVAQHAQGRCVVVDANLRPSVMADLPAYRRHVQQMLTLADVVKVSDEDLLHLDVPGPTVLHRARHLLQTSGAQLLALTLGAEGAWLLTAEGEWHLRESRPLQVLDTVGAGDSFLAGLLAALLARQAQSGGPLLADLDGATCLQLLAHAVASASLCVQQRGCVPPSWAQVRAWVEGGAASSQPAQAVASIPEAHAA